MKKFPIHSAAGISLWLFTVNIVLFITSFLLDSVWIATAAIFMSSMLFYLQTQLRKAMNSSAQEQTAERSKADSSFRP